MTKNNGKSKEKKPAKEKASPIRKPTSAEAAEPVAVMESRSGRDRRGNERRQKDVPVPVERRSLERRVKVSRRRQIDPTTCERDYTPEEIEFMSALDDYKRRSGRMFPTCSEVLEVIKAIGYEKRPPAPPVVLATEQPIPTGEPVSAI